ncbi:hypothetical protein CKO31_03910 [Thiohalocapsa halophila]|uniref:DUF502 domain-containing protein n=1 Tax=Thiohalocapsa halophila TaxID=69359 RepID=A0ABS1CDC1_9GAMM|nr:DUF502 domain-containing protein [Thiohalocapsa halophila]MBK1629900.1 hypothetical protein [Thiohalocapsa halophila]
MPERSATTQVLTRLRNLFLQGIALLAPLILTIALIIWLGRSVELVVGGALRQLLPPDWYIPGAGLAVGVVLTLAAGLLANLFLVRWLVNLLEGVLDRIPLVKSLFQGLKDVSRFFAQGSDQELGRPVSVGLPLGDGEMQLVGFVMQERATLPTGQVHADDAAQRIAVYLPMSYQVGGYTLYLDPARVTPLDVGTEQALRAVLTGGSLTGDQPAAAAGGGADTDMKPAEGVDARG